MSNILIKSLVRTRFLLTSRNRASGRIQKTCDDYLALAAKVDAESGARKIRVPPMLGVDEDMRDWSFFMILEHNTIVNRMMTTVVKHLVMGKDGDLLKKVDPKKDVMPSAAPGEEQIEAFRFSVEKHLKFISDQEGLRGTAKKRHPIFGDFNAHNWHCMFGFHLHIHLKQAEFVVNKVT